MNKLARHKLQVALVGVALCLAMALPLHGQAKAPQAQGTPARSIFDYKAELGLSDAQVEKIKVTLIAFQKQLGARREALAKANDELGKLLGEHAALDAIKAKLQQIGAIELDVRMLDVTTSRTVESVLTGEQMRKWRTMQQAARAPKKP